MRPKQLLKIVSERDNFDASPSSGHSQAILQPYDVIRASPTPFPDTQGALLLLIRLRQAADFSSSASEFHARQW